MGLNVLCRILMAASTWRVSNECMSGWLGGALWKSFELRCIVGALYTCVHQLQSWCTLTDRINIDLTGLLTIPGHMQQTEITAFRWEPDGTKSVLRKSVLVRQKTADRLLPVYHWPRGRRLDSEMDSPWSAVPRQETCRLGRLSAGSRGRSWDRPVDSTHCTCTVKFIAFC